MKIRRKTPKPSRSGRPISVVGYKGLPPRLTDLCNWFDLEYGGPLKLTSLVGQSADGGTTLVASHGPWQVLLQQELSPADAAAWAERLGWGHPNVAQIVPAAAAPASLIDQVLLGARLARGLTLLSDGTACDLYTLRLFNPSDWRDQRLEQFQIPDHVAVLQAESPEKTTDWFHTQGLGKFNLDDLEVFRPRGLPAGPTLGRLTELAGELVIRRPSLAVGSTASFPLLGLTLRIFRHRTATPSGIPLTLRTIDWREA
jgi:hypothetical protein